MRRHERGAAAVEFALIVPLLLALVLGIADFGRAYMVQSSLSLAAREGARAMALNPLKPADAQALAVKRAAELGVPGAIANTPACTGNPAQTTVTVSTTFDLLLPISDITITGKGVMRCGA